MGWSRSRRCLFLRRPAQKRPPAKALPATPQSQFDFVERLASGPVYEYIVLVTNDTLPLVGLAQPDQHLEAITSRPLLLHAVGRLVTTGRRKIIRLTSTHSMADRIRLALNRIGQFLNRLAQTAEQLTVEAIWAAILSAAFVKWLRGKVLEPVMRGNQVLLRLPS